MKRALVTGVTSFVGRAVADLLGERGVDVHATVRPTSNLDHLADMAHRPVLHTLDGSADALIAAVADAAPDVIVHLAGRYVPQPGPADVAGMVDDTVVFGASVLDAAVRAGVRAFVNTGSYVQYADGGGPEAAPSPLNAYAAAKEAFEAFVSHARANHGMTACSVILYDTYGPGDWRPRLMAALARAARQGTPVATPATDPLLEMVYIDDVARAFVLAAEMGVDDAARVDGRRFAVRTGTPQTIAGLAAAFERVSGRTVALDAGGYADAPPTVRALWQGDPVPDWSPEVSLDDGIARFLAAAPQGDA